MPDAREVLISRVGAQGDGVVETGGAHLFVPYTLSGERVRIEEAGGRVRLLEVIDPSPNRIAPVCRHFGVCGGCALQHMAGDAYLHWKRELVVATFAARGLSPVVADVLQPAGRRRRAVMTARQTDDGVELGYFSAGTHELVDVLECPVLEPTIVAALPNLRMMIAPLLPRREAARVTVTASDGGLDVAIDGVKKTLGASLRATLAASASAMGVARVSVNGDVAFQSQQPFLKFGMAQIAVPPAGFIQAVAAAERAMAQLVVDGVGAAKRVADVFSGSGAFTFPLAAKARVAAFDSDAAALQALVDGAKRASGLKPITATRRNLFREPLSALELNEHDAIVFDPPRAGAEAQARMIAKCKVRTIIAISCNPATLARDSKILIDGGYCLEKVTPVEQFRFSPHIEMVARFHRPKI